MQILFENIEFDAKTWVLANMEAGNIRPKLLVGVWAGEKSLLDD